MKAIRYTEGDDLKLKIRTSDEAVPFEIELRTEWPEPILRCGWDGESCWGGLQLRVGYAVASWDTPGLRSGTLSGRLTYMTPDETMPDGKQRRTVTLVMVQSVEESGVVDAIDPEMWDIYKPPTKPDCFTDKEWQELLFAIGRKADAKDLERLQTTFEEFENENREALRNLNEAMARKAGTDDLANKLDKNQGAANAGKVMKVNPQGVLVPAEEGGKVKTVSVNGGSAISPDPQGNINLSIGGAGFYNIDNEKPLESGHYTLGSAVTAVAMDSGIKAETKNGMILQFYDGEKWCYYAYQLEYDADDPEADDKFSDPDNWSAFESGSGGGGTASQYVLKLETNSARELESSDTNLSVNLRFTSQMYDSIGHTLTDSGEDASITIELQMEGAGRWTTVGTIGSFPSSAAGAGNYRTIDLSPYLQNGTQYVRFTARGNVSGQTAPLLTFTVGVAAMSAEIATNWGRAFVYDEAVASSANITIPVKMTGNVHKILYYEVLNSAGTKIREGSIEVGTAEYVESAFTGLTFEHPQTVEICTVRVRLRYGNSTVYTDWVEQNFMASTTESDAVLLCVNNVKSSVYNWTSERLLEYAVYNPGALTGTVVGFELTDSEEQTVWMTGSNGNAENGIVYDYTPYLGIENNTPSGRVRLFGAKLRVIVGGVPMRTLTYSVDNTNDFAPTVGANFILMPSGRSNYDSDRTVIHNETSVATEARVLQGVWENVTFEDDGWVTEGGVKMLRLFAGSKLTIPFECYSNTTQDNGLTIEVDARMRNISDEDAAVLKIGKEVNGQFTGLILYPKRGYFFKTTNNVAEFQDIEWQENKRTHLTVNIAPGLNVKGRTLNVVRLFVNDKINREITFTSADRFWDGASSGGIQIGGEGCDIDVFGMRVFKERLLSSGEVLNDVTAAESDIGKKKALIAANNIMEGGVIKYALAKEKYNTMVWEGVFPDKNNQVETTGNLRVSMTGDPVHSGRFNHMNCKGQGTSSKRYLQWNGSWSFNDDSLFVNDNGDEGVPWYQLRDGSPRATKLVGKRNWASSPQSHKAGMCDIVNAVYDQIFDGTSGWEPSGIKRTAGYENTKIAVEEEPFLFFVQATPDSEPVFNGLMTFGSAKGDKLTFGYDKSHPILKDYLMIEGSDQTPVLGLCQVPWFEDEVGYNEEEEYYEYNGMGSFDVTLGNRGSIGHFIDAHNTCYKYSTRIRYYNGRLDDLQLDAAADKSYQHFIVGQTYDNFYVYRYNWPTGRWVNAGVTKTNGAYDAVNLNEQLGLGLNPSSADFEGMLASVKAARIAAFRAVAGNHFHVNDTLFGMQINKLFGASDNRNKNTYPYYDPVDGVIRFGSDDNDTILPFNNQGQKQKPYWVEEHDFDNRPQFNGYFWAASGNAMYNLFEDAYPNELRTMMRRILSAMANLGSGYGEGGVMGCFERYFFKIQNYFPAVAYNEVARLSYEWAKILYDAGEYTNDTDPITQSLGDQLECEKEWVRQRIVYIASYCMYNAAMGGSIEFRQLNSASYQLKPAIKMYMYMQLGTSYRYPTGCNAPKRCEAGETVTIVCEGSDSIQTYIVGAEYLQDLGDLSAVGVTGSTSFANGKRLARLKVGNANASAVNFQPSAIASFPPNAVEIDLRNTEVPSIGSLSGATKLERFLSGGTAYTSLVLPQTNLLTDVELDSVLQTLVLRNQTGINHFEFTPTSLRSLTSGRCNVIDQAFVEAWVDGLSGDLSGYELDMDGLEWRGFAAARLVQMCEMGRLVLKGRIALDSNSISAEQLATVHNKLGSLMDSHELELEYTNVINIQMTKTAVTGGDEGSVANFTLSALNDNALTLVYSTDGVTWLPMSENPRLTMTSRTEVVNGCRYVYGTLTAEEEVTGAVQYRVRATDGVQNSVTLFFGIVTKNRIQSVAVSGTKYLTQANANYTFSAALTPANSSEVPTYSWLIESVGDVDTYEVEVTQLYSRVVRRSDNAVMIELPNANAASVHLATGNEMMAAKNNDTSFTVQCTVRGMYGSEVSAVYEVVGHAQFTPKAVQSYDPEEENYNPALVIYLKNNEATTGVTLHEETFQDGSRGFYMTQAEAATVTNLGTINGLTEIQDSNGYVVESHEDGVLNPAYYRFEDFDQFKYFVSIARIDVRNCSLLKRITYAANQGPTGQFWPNSIRRIVFLTGNSCSFARHDTMAQYTCDELHLPNTVDIADGENGFLCQLKVNKIYFDGSVSEWMNRRVLPRSIQMDRYLNTQNFAGNTPFDLYCKGEKITEISASIINEATFKRNLHRCKSLTTITGVVDSLTNMMFLRCTNLENINVSNSVTSIPEYCFYNCNKLDVFLSNNHAIPSNITSIAANALSGTACSFTEIPDSLTNLGNQNNMPNITAISYPNTMTTNPGGFSNCSNLESIYFRANESEEFTMTTFIPPAAAPKLSKVGYGEDGVTFRNNTLILPGSVTTIGGTDMGTSLIKNVRIEGLVNITSDSWLVRIMANNENNPKLASLKNPANIQGNAGCTPEYFYVGGMPANFNLGNWGRGNVNHLFVNIEIPPNVPSALQCVRILIPTGKRSIYATASYWSTVISKFIEYNFGLDRANIKEAKSVDDIIVTGVPLNNCGLSISGNTATITCTDNTFASAVAIKLHYRINGGSWSIPVNSGATFAVSANDTIEVYATHNLRGPSNMLKATWNGSAISYDYTNVYIDPDNLPS